MAKKQVSLVVLGHPLHATLILKPVDVDENAQHEKYVQLQSNITTYLQEHGIDGNDITYTQSLQPFLHIIHEQYILTLCSTLKKPKLFLQRNVKDICINAYMEAWLWHGK